MSSARLTALSVVLFMLVSAVAVSFLATPVAAASYPKPFTHVDGPVNGERFGSSVALFDLNNDGIADLVVGAPLNTTGGKANAGTVTVYLSSGGKPMSKIVVLNGSHADDRFGWSVADVGDVDGDGTPDLAVGAPLASPNGLTNAGTLMIFFGSASFDGKNNLTISGTIAGAGFGYSVSMAGELGVDPFADFLVGAPFCTAGTLTSAGCVYVYSGDPFNPTLAKTFTGTVANANLGWSVSGGFNVDTNTALDMVAGAPGQTTSGGAYIVRNIATSKPAIDIVPGKAVGDQFGYSVALMKDFNGDGFGDIAIGAPFNADNGTNAGEVSIIFGSSRFRPTIGLTLIGTTGEEFGWSLAAQDFHQDGFTDLIVGAPNSRLTAATVGRAYAFFGSMAPSTSPALIFVPDVGAGAFGTSVVSDGNIAGDAAPDLAVGDPLFKQMTRTAGRAYIYNGTVVPTLAPPFVKGKVCVPGTFDSTTGTCTVLSGFAVTLEASGFSLLNTTGVFNFTGVPGTYWLNATRSGYIQNVTYPLVLNFNDRRTVNFFPTTVPIVRGVVADALSRMPIKGATVALYNGTTPVNSTTTPLNGSYAMFLPLPYVPAVGKVTNVTVRAWDPIHYTSISAKIALKRNDSVVSNPILDLFPVLTGTARDAGNLRPIIGATLQATQGASVRGTATTNSKGAYFLRATNATAAKVYLNVTAATFARSQASVLVAPNDNITLDFFMVADTTPPTSQITPLLPLYTAAPVFTITATASDNDAVQLVQLWYRFNATGSFVLTDTLTAAPYTFSFNSTSARGDGRYEFYTIAVDYAGNHQAPPTPPATNMTWTFVDTRAPSSKANALPTYEKAANFTITATASDWDGIKQVGLYYRQGTTGAYSLYAQDTQAPYSWAFNTTKLGTGDGTYQFYTIAQDNAGNVEAAPASPDAQTTVDTTPPTLAITSPTAGQVIGTRWVNVTWTGSDAGSGISKFDVRLDSGAWVHAGTKLFYNFTSVADGSHTVSVNATDNAGNSKIVSVAFSVSTVAPTVTITAPSNNAVLATSSVTVNWTVTNAGAGLATIEVRQDNGAWTSVGTSATTYTFSSVADGFHNLSVRATGLNGAQGMATVAVRVDATPPALSITSPANNAIFNVTTVTVTWTASDSGTGLAKVEVRLDGGPYVVATGTSHSFTGLADGTHIISVRATDNVGNTATALVTVIVDTTPPTVSFTSPAANSWQNSASVSVAFTATDATSGILQVFISVDGGPPVNATGQTSYTFTGLADGSHTVTLTAKDKAGHTSSGALTFRVDTTPPSVTITAPTAGATVSTSDVTITWTQSDAGSGVASAKISVDSGAFQDLGVVTSKTITGLADGQHTVTVRVTDVAGNTKDASVSFTVSVPSGPSGLGTVLIGGIVVLVVVVVAAAALLLRRRRAKLPPPPPPESGPGEGPEQKP